jgi:hypothetical protein
MKQTAMDENQQDMDPAGINQIGQIMSDLEAADFELLEPPAGIWDGIEVSITSELARKPPHRDTPSQMVVEYRIDARDVLIDVGDGWADFAHDNGAAELAVPATDRTLWSYFDRAEIREIWQLLVQRVRTLQTAARVPFRCDASDARRWFEMVIVPGPDGAVHFRSVLAFQEARPRVALLDPEAERDADARAIPLCSWCGRVEHDGRWLDVEEFAQASRLLERLSMPPISYGICAGCRKEMAAELLVPYQAVEPLA